MLSDQHVARLAGEMKDRVATLGELVAIGEEASPAGWPLDARVTGRS